MFDATHLQSVQPPPTIKVAEIPTSKRGKMRHSERSRGYNAARMLSGRGGFQSRGKTYNSSTESFDSAALRLGWHFDVWMLPLTKKC